VSSSRNSTVSKNDKNAAFLKSLSQKPELIQIIAGTLASTISSFTRVPTTAGESQLLLEQNDLRDWAAAGVIRFQGPALSLEIVLGIPKDLLFSMASNAFQQDITDLATAQEIAGEILNISFGTIDPMMRGKSIHMKSSFPLNFSSVRLNALVMELPHEAISIPLVAAGKNMTLLILASGSLQQKWGYTP